MRRVIGTRRGGKGQGMRSEKTGISIAESMDGRTGGNRVRGHGGQEQRGEIRTAYDAGTCEWISKIVSALPPG